MGWGYPPPTNCEIIISSFLWRAPYKPSLSTDSGPGIPPNYGNCLHTLGPHVSVYVSAVKHRFPPYVVLGSVCFWTCDRPPREVVVLLPWMDIAATNVWRWDGATGSNDEGCSFWISHFPRMQILYNISRSKKRWFQWFHDIFREKGILLPKPSKKEPVFFVSVDLVKEVT